MQFDNLIKNPSASFYYISIAFGVIIVALVVVKNFVIFIKSFRISELKERQIKIQLTVSSIGFLTITGITYWLLYYVYVAIIEITKWLLIILPKIV
ncbi:protein of unknown function [Ruminococcaceae bacterium BL-6]|nr:protein of unknown function [Ruminococcaceae bacterium BL-6]